MPDFGTFLVFFMFASVVFWLSLPSGSARHARRVYVRPANNPVGASASAAEAQLDTTNLDSSKLEQRLKSAMAAHKSCPAQIETLNARVAQLDSLVAERDQTIRDLTKQLDSLVPESVENVLHSENLDVVVADLRRELANRDQRIRDMAASTETVADMGEPDDLKLIHGIGKRIESMLHGIGVTHFAQIARWSSQDVTAVDEALPGFRGRIKRDRWVSQAKKLTRVATAT